MSFRMSSRAGLITVVAVHSGAILGAAQSGNVGCPCVGVLDDVQVGRCNYMWGGLRYTECISVNVDSQMVDYPASYGLTCTKHLEPGHNDCWDLDNNEERLTLAVVIVDDPSGNGARAPWCDDHWCFVDPCRCDVQTSQSTYLTGTEYSYSYETCGAADTYTATVVGSAQAECQYVDALEVVSPNFQHIQGTYDRIIGTQINKMPVYRHPVEQRWIYPMANGRWGIGGPSARNAGFESTDALAYCPNLHGRVGVTERACTWMRFDGSDFVADGSITISVTTSSSPSSPSPAPVADSGQRSPQPWVVVSGPCVVDSEGCATSQNFPGFYRPDEDCVMTAPGGTVIEVLAFNTEYYDKLTVNGNEYFGRIGPVGEAPVGNVMWQSDRSSQSAGWHLCLNLINVVVGNTGAADVVPRDEDASSGGGYTIITSGTCVSNSLYTLLRASSCELAASALGLPVTTASDRLSHERPRGCIIGSDDSLGFNEQPNDVECGSLEGATHYDCICSQTDVDDSESLLGDAVSGDSRGSGQEEPTCGLTQAACRAAVEREGLVLGASGSSQNFSGSYAETGCYAWASGNFEGRAFYGLANGEEVISEDQLTELSSGAKFRVTGTFCCGTGECQSNRRRRPTSGSSAGGASGDSGSNSGSSASGDASGDATTVVPSGSGTTAVVTTSDAHHAFVTPVMLMFAAIGSSASVAAALH